MKLMRDHLFHLELFIFPQKTMTRLDDTQHLIRCKSLINALSSMKMIHYFFKLLENCLLND